MSDNLTTAKQRMFVAEYLIDLNGKQAAIRAGYSEKTAAEQASRLLTNVNVQRAIEEAQQAKVKRAGITADYVLNSLKKIADESMGVADYNPANKALELLGKHLKLFTDKIEADVNATVDINVTIVED